MIFPFLLPQSKRLGAIFHNLTMRRIISESSLVLWTVRSEQTGLGISASLAFITGTKKKKKVCKRCAWRWGGPPAAFLSKMVGQSTLIITGCSGKAKEADKIAMQSPSR